MIGNYSSKVGRAACAPIPLARIVVILAVTLSACEGSPATPAPTSGMPAAVLGEQAESPEPVDSHAHAIELAQTASEEGPQASGPIGVATIPAQPTTARHSVADSYSPPPATDVLFLIDSSASVKWNCPEGLPLRASLPFFIFTLATTLGDAQPQAMQGLRIGAATFDHRASAQDWISFRPTEFEHYTRWAEPISVSADEGENYPEALKDAGEILAAGTEGRPPAKRKVLIIITDGNYSGSGANTSESIGYALSELKANGVAVHAVVLCASKLTKLQRQLWQDSTRVAFYGAEPLLPEWVERLATAVLDDYLLPMAGMAHGWMVDTTNVSIPAEMRFVRARVVTFPLPGATPDSLLPPILDPAPEIGWEGGVSLTPTGIPNLWEWSTADLGRLVPAAQCQDHAWALAANTSSASYYVVDYLPPTYRGKLSVLDSGGRELKVGIEVLGDQNPVLGFAAHLESPDLPSTDFNDFAECYSVKVERTDPNSNPVLERNSPAQSEIEWASAPLMLDHSQDLTLGLRLLPLVGGDGILLDSVPLHVEFLPVLKEVTMVWECEGSKGDCKDRSTSDDKAEVELAFSFRGSLETPDYYFEPKGDDPGLCEINRFKLGDPAKRVDVTSLDAKRDGPASHFGELLDRKGNAPPSLFQAILNCGSLEIRWDPHPAWPVYKCDFPGSDINSGQTYTLACRRR